MAKKAAAKPLTRPADTLSPGERAMIMREDCDKGFFVAFDYSSDALAEVSQFFKRTGKTIRALTVKDILDEAKLAMKLA